MLRMWTTKVSIYGVVFRAKRCMTRTSDLSLAEARGNYYFSDYFAGKTAPTPKACGVGEATMHAISADDNGTLELGAEQLHISVPGASAKVNAQPIKPVALPVQRSHHLGHCQSTIRLWSVHCSRGDCAAVPIPCRSCRNTQALP